MLKTIEGKALSTVDYGRVCGESALATGVRPPAGTPAGPVKLSDLTMQYADMALGMLGASR